MKQKTLIAMLLDESTSMKTVKDSAISGVNEYIQSLKDEYEKSPELGEINFTLATFSSDMHLAMGYKPTGSAPADKVRFLIQNADITEIEPIPDTAYNPEGNTPLLEAIGTAIETMDKYVDMLTAGTSVSGTIGGIKPGSPTEALLGLGDTDDDEEIQYKVIIVTQTDGQENSSSHQWTKDRIIKMQKEREDRGNWTFAFLGADMDAIGEGMKIGVATGNALGYSQTKSGYASAFSSLSVASSSLRRSASMKSTSLFSPDPTSDGEKDKPVGGKTPRSSRRMSK